MIVLSDNSINSYGFRVLTSGADISRFKNNPVLLDSHSANSGASSIMGRWENIKVEGDRLVANPVFDLEDERAATLAGKYKRGFLNAASIGFRILATSEAAEDMLPGQTLPTVTQYEIFEASLVPIPSNGSAVRLYDKDGQQVQLDNKESVALALGATLSSPKPDINMDEKGFWAFLKSKLDPPKQGNPPTPEVDIQALQDQIDSLTLAKNTYEAKLAELKESHTTEVEGLKASLAAAKAELNQPAADSADHADDTDPAGTQQDPSFKYLTDVDRAARAKWDARNKK